MEQAGSVELCLPLSWVKAEFKSLLKRFGREQLLWQLLSQVPFST